MNSKQSSIGIISSGDFQPEPVANFMDACYSEVLRSARAARHRISYGNVRTIKVYVDKGTKVKHLVEGANSLQTDLMRLAG